MQSAATACGRSTPMHRTLAPARLRTTAAAPSVPRTQYRACSCSTQPATTPPAAATAAPAVLARRALLAGAAVAAVATLAPVPSALAFGSGFPGYDVNLDARKRAAERNKRETDQMMERAAEYRAKLAADKAAAAAGVAAAPPKAAAAVAARAAST